MTNNTVDEKILHVVAETSEKFPKLAECMNGWEDVLFADGPVYELGQLVFYDGRWCGAFLWNRARNQLSPRDRYLGWDGSLQAERHHMVIECVGFQPRLNTDYQPDYGGISMKAAVGTLQQNWEDFFSYRPLLADTYAPPGDGFTSYFQKNGWKRTTDKSPRVRASHWVKELVPDARNILTARRLDTAYTGGPATNMDGLLPIQNALLESFKDAFKDIHDPRERNRHYPIEGVLAISFLALISGCSSINAIQKFSKRLSGSQAKLLGLPYNQKSQQFDLPNYHTYYRLLPRLDYMKLAESFIGWLRKHMKVLPDVLHPGGPVVRDTLFAFVHGFRHPPKPMVEQDYELPVGIDPDAPDGLKRDANGVPIE
jgi:hypothetical protein